MNAASASRLSWVVCGLALWLGAVGAAIARASGEVPAADNVVELADSLRNAPQAAPVPQAATFVGDQKCLSCHDDQRASYLASPHHRATDPRTPAAKQGCETCHGAGSVHADDPNVVPLKNFANLPPEEVNATCTSCHNRGEHALWDGSQHERRDLSCLSCHSIHEAKSEEGNLKEKSELALCATCHRDKIAKLDRSGHMPVREGKMDCTTCHNTHGSTNVRLLRTGDSVAELCTSCHADKRGPYLWEHAPGRDGCVTCHDPHGSSNERMLVAKTPMLCQRCHVGTRHPSTIYDDALVKTSVRVYARSCVTCHTNIHGSNHPSGQFFIR